jgi:chromosomal replication initiation ATPase DnaA
MSTRTPGPWQPALPLPGTTSFRAEDFVLTPANRTAHAMVTSWPDWPERRLALVGAAGSGKTHLAHLWAEQSGAQSLKLPAVGDAMPAGVMEASEGSCFLADGMDDTNEKLLFHLLNAAKERSLFLLLTASEGYRPTLPDLASRWNALPKAALNAPDDALLEAALLKQCADRQLKVGPEVIRYLLPRLPRTLHEAGAIIARMDIISLALGRRITLDVARKALENHPLA